MLYTSLVDRKTVEMMTSKKNNWMRDIEVVLRLKSEKWEIGSNQSQEIGTELNNFSYYPLLYLVQSDYCVWHLLCLARLLSLGE